MKSKKQQQTLALNFLKNFRHRHRFGYGKIYELLEQFEVAAVDSETVFRGMVRELQGNEELLEDFNEFLNDEHRVREVSCEQIAELFNHVYGAMQRSTPDKIKFMRFLNVSDELGKKLDEIKVMSLEELGEMIMEAVSGNGLTGYWGQAFIDSLDQTIKEYITEQVKVRKEAVKTPQAAQPLHADRQPGDPVKTVKQGGSEGTGGKAKGKPQTSLAPTNGSVGLQIPAKTPIAAQAKEVPLIVVPEEPQQFNLKVEAEVILALKSNLSPIGFQDVIKSIQLFSQAVISYQEFVTMNERTLLSVDKNVCAALREMVESRLVPAQKMSCFNIRLATIRSNDTTHNLKYFRIVSQIATNEQFSDGIVNKTYVAIASGHESAGNLDDPVAAKIPKNSAEQTLFKVEDEMHETDAILAQFRVTLGFINQIAKSDVPQSVVDRICTKIANARTLSLLYGTKGPMVLEEVRQRQPMVIETVVKRLEERIAVLVNGKKDLNEGSWAPRVAFNFYKSLDQRSTSLKVQERNFLNNKALVEQMKTAGVGGPYIRTWLSRMVGTEAEDPLTVTAGSTGKPTCWNPVFVMSLRDQVIMSDVYNLLKVYLQQSKFNAADKTKFGAFLEKTFLNYFGISKLSTTVSQSVPLDSLGSVLGELERQVGPPKQFYYSDKIVLKFNLDAYKAMQEFSGSLSDETEPKNGGLTTPTPLFPTFPASDGAADGGEATSSDKDDVLENSDVSRHFKKLIESNGSEDDNGREMNIEQVDVDPNRRVFYASYHFYVVYQYFMLLYERLSLAYAFAMNSPVGSRVYEVFLDMLYLNLFGVIDESGFEDSMRMVFGHVGGVLLNFERILNGCLKHIPSDDFAAFVMTHNAHLFGEKGTGRSQPESILFAKTCYKLNEMNNKDNKGYKVNSFSSFNNNYNLTGTELVKFEYLATEGLFIVHKVRSLFPEGRKNGGSNQQMIECHYGLLTRPVHASSRRSGKVKKSAVNSLTYAFDVKKRQLQLKSGEFDDVLFLPRVKVPTEPRKQRILKKNKDRFKELLRGFKIDKN